MRKLFVLAGITAVAYLMAPAFAFATPLSFGCAFLNQPSFDGVHNNFGVSTLPFFAGETITVTAGQPVVLGVGSLTDIRLLLSDISLVFTTPWDGINPPSASLAYTFTSNQSTNVSYGLFPTLVDTAFWTVTCAAASPAQADSWNLSRAMMTSIGTNPLILPPPATDVWGFMENKTGVVHPLTDVNYTLLPILTANCLAAFVNPPTFACWQTASQLPLIGVSSSASVTFSPPNDTFQLIQGMAMLFPDINSQAIVSWESPISGSVKILGRIADIDNNCGDGIRYSVRKVKLNNAPNLVDVVSFKNVGGGGPNPAADTFASTETVLVGTRIYFIVDKKGNDLCDSTTLDVLIAKLP